MLTERGAGLVSEICHGRWVRSVGLSGRYVSALVCISGRRVAKRVGMNCDECGVVGE